VNLHNYGFVIILMVGFLAACGSKEQGATAPSEGSVESSPTSPNDGPSTGVDQPPPPREPSPESLAAEAPLPTIATLPAPRGIADSPKGLKNGDFAPELFHLDMTTGKRFRLSDWTGPEASKHQGAVVVGFTASWCGPCKQSYPYLKKMQDQYGDKLKVILVTTDATIADKEKHLNIVQKSGLEAPLLDPDPHSLRAWLGQRRNIPHFYIINRAGEVLVQDRGFGKKVRKVLPGQIGYAVRNPDYVVRR